MTQAHKTPGAKVKLKEKMFSAPYAPFYEHHRERTFEVLNGNVYPGHVKVRDLETTDEFVFHDDEIVTVK